MLATGGIRHKHFLNLTYLLLNIYNTPKNFPKNLPNFYIHTAKFGRAIAPLKLKI